MKYFVLIALLVSCLGCSVDDVVDPHLLKTIDIPKGSGGGLRICVSPTGSRFASGIGVHGYEMNIWNCEGFIKRTFHKREDNLLTLDIRPELPITGIVFSPDWKYFVSFQRQSRRKQGLSLWDMRWDGGRRYLPDLPDHRVELGNFDTKGERLACVDYGGPDSKEGLPTTQVTILSGDFFRESVTLENAGEERFINLMAFNGDRLVACGHPGLIMWDLNTGKIIFTDDEKRSDSGRGDTLMFSLDGKQFIIATRGINDGLEIRNSVDGSLVKNMPEYEPRAISKDWKWFATLDGMHENIQIHDMENGEIEFTLRGHTGQISDIDFSADGSRLVSVASDRTFKIWDLTK
jgi:WD40 repeat protein